MFIKICGTTNLADALLSVELGADALGFIFAPSRRRVTIAQVAAIVSHLPPGVARVGVFTEPDVPFMTQAVAEAGLTAVQMHWSYRRDIVTELRTALPMGVERWQVLGFPVGQDEPNDDTRKQELEFAKQAEAALSDAGLDVVLVDTLKGQQSGGLGQSFPWIKAAPVLAAARAEVQRLNRKPELKLPEVILAGGLTAENIAQAIGALAPWGVDVVSGVEDVPGRKHPGRLGAFIREARRASAKKDSALPGVIARP